MIDRSPQITGGCQCGAVRYAIYGASFGSHICHCRMCQKAFGSPFAALTNVRRTDFSVTRGRIAHFRSSAKVRRGFCSVCGTPLTCEDDGSDEFSLSISSCDTPDLLAPKRQIGTENRMPWFGTLSRLPEKTTDESAEQGGFADEIAEIRATNNQHPDHDTQQWPPADQNKPGAKETP